MKKLIFFLLLIISNFSINSQTFEAKPFNFTWTADSVPKPLVLDSFNVNTFLLGFQWSGTPRMNQALRHNANAGAKYQYDPNTFDGANLIHIIAQPSIDAHNSSGVNYSNAHFIQYEPTLYTTDFTKFIPRYNDPTNAIFGFSNIKGTVLPSTQFAETNYNRLILYKDSLANYSADSIVLSGINPNDKFETYRGTGQHNGFTGDKWNLSINLRRLRPEIDQTFGPTDTILVIRLPYTAKDTLGILRDKYINFDSIPKTNIPTDTISLDYYQYRGYAMGVENNLNLQNQIVITKAMLDTNRAAPDITISAHFSLFKDSINIDLDLQKYYNPRFQPGFKDTAHSLREFEHIQNIDIEVKYYGNCDVAIDWLRIETDKAQDMLRGKFDNNGTAGAKYVLESFIDTIPKIKHNGKQLFKIYRFYAQDSEKDSPVLWGQLRYYNLVTNGLAITRDNPYLPEQYSYYTKSLNRYLAMKISENEHDLPNPALRTTFDALRKYPDASWKHFGHKFGFRGYHTDDTLTSGYETFIDSWSLDRDPLIFNNMKNYNDSLYGEHAWHSTSTQMMYGRYFHGLFYNKFNYKFLYNGNPWVMNLFVGTNLNKDTILTPGIVSNPQNYVVSPVYLKPKTGEEIRLLMNANIIMGAKGILYDREENKKINPTIFLGVGNGLVDVDFDINHLNTFAENDTVDGDYPNGIADVYDYSSYINKDTISKYTLIQPNRIYVGVKSVRTTIKHINDWIRLNDIELMDMRLQATYSKGFKTFENWNPYKFQFWGNSPLRKIVNLDVQVKL